MKKWRGCAVFILKIKAGPILPLKPVNQEKSTTQLYDLDAAEFKYEPSLWRRVFYILQALCLAFVLKL
jgi:hypothetical protein